MRAASLVAIALVACGRPQAAPPDLDALERSALLHRDRHEFALARDIARRVLERDPGRVTAQLLLGDAALELGDYDAAHDAYQRALDLHPDLRSYERGAHLRFLHGDLAGAEELLGFALEAGSARDPVASAWCWVALGSLRLLGGEAGQASAAANRALALAPDYLPALSLEARARAEAGDRAGAIRILERLTVRPHGASDLLELAELRAEAGDALGAASALGRAWGQVNADPRSLAAYLARRGEHPEAAVKLAQHELARRDTLEAEDTMALALLRAGRLPEAVAWSSRSLRLGTPDARFWLHRALILGAAGDAAGARAALRRALELNPRVDARLRAEALRALGGAS